jgi:hypothetical protein
MSPTFWLLYRATVGVAIACAVTPAVFIIIYWITAPWWKSEAGWRTMTLMWSVMLAFGVTLANAFGWLRSFSLLTLLVVQLVIFLLIWAALFWNLLALLHAQVLPAIRKKDDAPTQR